MAPDTNFKNADPKKQYNTPENPKARHGGYDKGQNFDPTDGYDDHPDDQWTSDMIHEEDRFFSREGHQYEEEEETEESKERKERREREEREGKRAH